MKKKQQSAAIPAFLTKKKPLSFLSSVMDLNSLGVKYLDKKTNSQIIRPCNRNHTIMDAINLNIAFKNNGGKYINLNLARLNSEKLNAHCSGDETFYFHGNYKNDTIACIDIDCHGKGTLAGATKAINKIKQLNMFKNIYFEASTNGNGIHAYFICHISNCRDVYVNQLKQLRVFLNRYCDDCDISNIDIQGQPASATFTDGACTDYKRGTNIKIPRGVISRFSELKATSYFSLPELVAFIKENELPEVNVDNDAIKFRSNISVSNGGKYIDESRLNELERTGQEYADRYPLHFAKNNAKVVAVDWAIALVIIEHCENDANEDYSQPILRYKAMWKSLNESGAISRAWSNTRFSAIRNKLIEIGHIDVIDMNYTYFTDHRQGKGTACKWRASAILLDILKTGSIYIRKSVKTNNETLTASTERKKTSLLIGSFYRYLKSDENVIQNNKIVGLKPKYKPPINDLYSRCDEFMQQAA